MGRIPAHEAAPATTEAPAYYDDQVLGDDPAAPGAAALDLSTAVDGVLWVAVLGENEPRQSRRSHDAIINIGFVPERGRAGDGGRRPLPRHERDRPDDAVGCLAGLDRQASTARTPRYYVTSARSADTTSGLDRPGVVRLQLPCDLTQVGTSSTLDDPDAAGTGDLPPEIDARARGEAPLLAARVPRRRLRSSARLLWVGANAAEVEQVQEAAPEFLGTGTGDAAQTVTLVHKPVMPGTAHARGRGARAGRAWTEVDDFDASREDDRHYVLDPEAGTVQLRRRRPRAWRRRSASASA